MLAGASVGEALLAPTVIYVRAVLELLGSGADVRGLAHITGDGVLNLRRLNDGAGFVIEEPLAVPPICSWLCEQGSLDAAHAYQVFNMGCGFVACVGAADADAAVALLHRAHPGARVIGHVSGERGRVSLPSLGVAF